MENDSNKEINNEQTSVVNIEPDITNIEVPEVTTVFEDAPASEVVTTETAPEVVVPEEPPAVAVEEPVPQAATPEVVVPVETPEVVVQEPVAQAPVATEAPKADNSFVEKERKVWPFVVLGIILILGGVFAYYYFVMTKPINVITKVFNTAYKNVEKSANEYVSSTSDAINTFNFESTVAFTSDYEGLKEMSGIKANIKAGYDFTNKDKNLIDADVKVGDSTLFNAAASIADGKLYLDLKDAYKDVVYMESNEESLIDVSSLNIDKNEVSKKKDEYLHVISVVKNAILENISEEKLAKKIMLKDIDGKKVPVVEVTYNIDYPEYKKLHNGVINALLSDEKALETLAGKDNVTEYKKELTERKDNLSELDFENNVNVVLDIEAITNKLVFLDVKDGSDEISYKVKGSETDISLKTLDEGTIDLVIDESENKIFVDAKLIMEEEANRFTITIKLNEENKKSEKASISFVMYDPKETNKEMFNITCDIAVKLDEAVKTVDMTNAVALEELSEKEQQEFMEAFMSSMAVLDSLEEM